MEAGQPFARCSWSDASWRNVNIPISPLILMTRDKHGVGMMVLSITSPGCQGEADQEKSEALAKRANDYMADIVSKNPTRFQGYASVSMHDPTEAAQELTRAVKKLGLKGCMLNDCKVHVEELTDSIRAVEWT